VEVSEAHGGGKLALAGRAGEPGGEAWEGLGVAGGHAPGFVVALHRFAAMRDEGRLANLALGAAMTDSFL
jgi:hypothetical protein